MTERSVQLGIFRRFTSGILIPNWQPPNWWECDVARIMPSGRWHEYEIKLTKADFLADQKKSQERGHGRERHSKIKHLSLAFGETTGPNCFWYVLPQSVADVVQIPDWAGVVIATPDSKGVTWVSEAKKAPLLHKEPFQFKAPEQNVFYYRMWAHLQKLERARKAA